MDNEAHVENSSSQNVNETVFGRIERGASRKGLYAVAEDGSSFFIPRLVADTHHLHAGQELDGNQFSNLKREAERVALKQKAVELLANRDHSVQELRIKLVKREFDTQLIDQVLNQLLERGYLDDHRFAEIWIRSRLRKRPESPVQLKAGLMRAGVSREIAEQAISDADVDFSRVVADAVARELRKGKGPQKILQALSRKGFSYGDIKREIDGQSE
jgi:regulatory protein